MKVIPIENFSKFMTKGTEYEVVHKTESNVVIVDDTGDHSGWSLTRFENVTDHLEVFGWSLDTNEEISRLETIKMERV